MIVLDMARGEITQPGGVLPPVRLSHKESKLMEALSSGRPATFDFILSSMYGDSPPKSDCEMLGAFVWRIRRKMKAAGWPDMVATIWGIGFVLSEAIEVANDPAKMDVSISPSCMKLLEKLLRSHPERSAASLVLTAMRL